MVWERHAALKPPQNKGAIFPEFRRHIYSELANFIVSIVFVIIFKVFEARKTMMENVREKPLDFLRNVLAKKKREAVDTLEQKIVISFETCCRAVENPPHVDNSRFV